MSQSTSIEQKQKEVEMAWKQHRRSQRRHVPSKERAFEIDERSRSRGRWY